MISSKLRAIQSCQWGSALMFPWLGFHAVNQRLSHLNLAAPTPVLQYCIGLRCKLLAFELMVQQRCFSAYKPPGPTSTQSISPPGFGGCGQVHSSLQTPPASWQRHTGVVIPPVFFFFFFLNKMDLMELFVCHTLGGSLHVFLSLYFFYFKNETRIAAL